MISWAFAPLSDGPAGEHVVTILSNITAGLAPIAPRILPVIKKIADQTCLLPVNAGGTAVFDLDVIILSEPARKLAGECGACRT